MKAFRELVGKKTSANTNGSAQTSPEKKPTSAAPQQQSAKPASGRAEDSTADENIAFSQSGIFARQTEAERKAAVKTGHVGHATPTQAGGSDGKAFQDALMTSVWIDSETKRNICSLTDDMTLTIAKSFNNPSLGLFFVQQHAHTRTPKIIECGRTLGKTVQDHEGVLRDASAVNEQVRAFADNKAFARIADKLSRDVTRLRSEMPLMTGPEATMR